MKLGIDIGGTKINVGLLDAANRVIARKKILIDEVADLVDTLKDAVRLLNKDEDKITFCGVGIPGTVSHDGRRVLKAPNLTILNTDFVKKMEEGLQIPVRLVQDSRAAAWGEYIAGAGAGSNTLVCITLGTGIGTGIVLNGHVYHGALGSAGEMGHIPVVENGRSCGCGKKGCLEKYAAGLGLDRTAGEILGKGKKGRDLFREA